MNTCRKSRIIKRCNGILPWFLVPRVGISQDISVSDLGVVALESVLEPLTSLDKPVKNFSLFICSHVTTEKRIARVLLHMVLENITRNWCRLYSV